MEYYLGVAREKRISEEEIGVAQSIVMAVAAGKIDQQLGEVRKKMKSSEKSDK